MEYDKDVYVDVTLPYKDKYVVSDRPLIQVEYFKASLKRKYNN